MVFHSILQITIGVVTQTLYAATATWSISSLFVHGMVVIIISLSFTMKVSCQPKLRCLCGNGSNVALNELKINQ